MRGMQTDNSLYIYNAWVNNKRIYANNNEGLSMTAMEEAARGNPEIEKRVDFFRYRVQEEFYSLKDDPDCLKNLIDDPSYAKQVNDMQKNS